MTRHDSRSYLIGKTAILRDGTEDVITGYDPETRELFSATRRWDVNGKEVLSGDPEQSVLAHKQTMYWEINIGGYGPNVGNFSVLNLTVKNQHLAALLVRVYNERAEADNKPDDFLLAMGPTLRTEMEDVNRVFMDEEAREIIRNGDLLRMGWRPNASVSDENLGF